MSGRFGGRGREPREEGEFGGDLVGQFSDDSICSRQNPAMRARNQLSAGDFVDGGGSVRGDTANDCVGRGLR